MSNFYTDELAFFSLSYALIFHQNLKTVIFTFALAACAPMKTAAPLPSTNNSPNAWSAQCKAWDEWDKPGPAYRVYGNTWYVGTCGITALLVDTGKGLILLDTGTEVGADLILSNIRSLGYDPKDIKLILSSHEHFDHVGGMQKMKSATGAQVVASGDAASVLRSGKADPRDPQYGMHEAMTPVDVDQIVDPDQTLILGNTAFVAIATPGHTPGALSWTWKSCEGNDCRNIVYADSLSPVSRDNYRFSEHPEYLAAYRASLVKLTETACDILLTPHPSGSEMERRAAAGSFVGGVNCKSYMASITQRLDQKLREEQQ